MNKFINSCSCPQCDNPLPFLARFSRWKKIGFFPQPKYECFICGTISKIKVSWPDALWAWPLTFLVVVGIAHLLRSVPLFASFLDNPSGIGAIVFGVIAGILSGVGIRRGFRLFRVIEEPPHRE